MIQVYPDVTLLPMLRNVVLGGVDYRLYTNNLTPDVGTVLADFTEAVYAGYAAVNVPGVDFTTSSVVAHKGALLAAPIGIANGSGADQSAYGYFATQGVGMAKELLFAARFDSPPQTVPDGDSFVIVPIIGDRDGRLA